MGLEKRKRNRVESTKNKKFSLRSILLALLSHFDLTIKDRSKEERKKNAADIGVVTAWMRKVVIVIIALLTTDQRCPYFM